MSEEWSIQWKSAPGRIQSENYTNLNSLDQLNGTFYADNDKNRKRSTI